MHDVLTQSGEWKTLRAVRGGRVFVAPNLPFGWIEEPPSINPLLGLLAAVFSAVVYGHVLNSSDLDAVPAVVSTIHP